jgi:hypothetical protein
VVNELNYREEKYRAEVSEKAVAVLENYAIKLEKTLQQNDAQSCGDFDDIGVYVC